LAVSGGAVIFYINYFSNVTSEFTTMILHLIRPYWLWMLLPAFLYLVWVIYSFRRRNPWKKVCDPHLLPALLQSSPQQSQSIFYFSLFLFYAVCIFALSGPAWKKAQLPVYRDLNSMMIVLDLSAAMNETDLKPDRLSRAKYKIRDLINSAQNTQMGLVVFTEEAFSASPLSQDANTLSALLDELSPDMMPVAGSDSGQGLTEGFKLLKQVGAEHGTELLITASNPTANSWSAAKSISDGGGHLNVLAVLDSNAANQTTIANLQQLAKTGGGTFYLFSADASDIQNILNSAGTKQIVNNETVENAYLWLDAGPWFCLLLIPIALLVLRENMRHEKH
jgi:Ca-activated chloride channel family protein